LCLLAAWCGLNFQTFAQEDESEVNQTAEANQVSPNLVVSQFQVAGGTSNNEFIELHNTSSSAVDLNGFRIVYRSTAGTNDVNFAEWTTSTNVPAGGYYLIAFN
jgi:hypothetical protein